MVTVNPTHFFPFFWWVGVVNCHSPSAAQWRGTHHTSLHFLVGAVVIRPHSQDWGVSVLTFGFQGNLPNHRLWNKKGRDVSYVSSWSTSDMAVTTAHLKGDMSEERPGDRNITVGHGDHDGGSPLQVHRRVPTSQSWWPAMNTEVTHQTSQSQSTGRLPSGNYPLLQHQAVQAVPRVLRGQR